MTRTIKTVHTLNARDHVLLEVMRDHFKLGPSEIFHEIREMRNEVERQLARKGINYEALRSALVPDRKRSEFAFVFDSTRIESCSYGHEIFRHLIPLLDPKANNSILMGDYLDVPGMEDLVFHAFRESVRLVRVVDFAHPSQFYMVYLNNLTDTMVERINNGLLQFSAYVGAADLTYSCRLKLLLSTMLVNLGIKHGKIIIQGHEDDCAQAEDVNMCGFPFEDSGYVCRSVQDYLAGVLLSYKIERPVAPGFEVDTEFALNTLGIFPRRLDEFQVIVEEAKLDYVKRNKSASAERAGITAMSCEELAQLIKSKISASYIYNLGASTDGSVAKFNVMLEHSSSGSRTPTRLLASLEYQPERKRLRLITLF
jgi:hypothetical protein